MPRFLYSKNPDLSDLNRAKRIVNKNNKARFLGQDPTHASLGETASSDAKFTSLVNILTAIYTSLLDISNGLQLFTGETVPKTIIAQFSQIVGGVVKSVSALSLLLTQIPSLNSMTQAQVAELADLVSKVSNTDDVIDNLMSGLSELTQQRVDEITAPYKRALGPALQRISGLLRSYRQVPSVSTGRLLGGALVPGYNGLGVFGSDGYKIGQYFTYSDPRRFY